MRLPTSKVYRAFPELDAFSDEQCEAFVERACALRRAETRAWIGGAYAAFLGVLLAWIVLFVAVVAFIGGFVRLNDFVVVVIGTAGAFLLPTLAYLLVRDAWMQQAVENLLQLSRCASCAYPLLGLRAQEGAVTCPECGLSVNLAEYNLKEEQLTGA